jgi:methylglutaconyl-CoA hydratase
MTKTEPHGVNMTYQDLLVEIRQGIGIVWMNRPERRNAFDETMITEMTAALRALDDEPDVRILILAGTGECFCTGADRGWLERMMDRSFTQKQAEAMKLATLLHTIHTLKKPIIARIHGPAFDDGAGMVAACDMAVASYDAEFRVAGVCFGIVPAIIAPYLIRAMGERMAQQYLLSAETLTAADAYRTGLVTDIVPREELDTRINELLGRLIHGAPDAQALSKAWIRTAAGVPIDLGLIEESVARIAAAFGSEECREGFRTLKSKRKPSWLTQKKRTTPEKKTAPRSKAKDKAKEKSANRAKGKG